MLINNQNYPRFTNCTTRHDRMEGAIPGGGNYGNPLDAVDYSDPVAVKDARDAIIQMAMWNHPILDGIFKDGCEVEALEAFADMMLCEKAAFWQQDHPGLQSVEGLNEDNGRAAKIRFMSLLSQKGLEFITQTCEHVPGGLRYMANSGIAEVDGMLVTVLSYLDAADVLERAGKFSEAADAYAFHGAHAGAARAFQFAARVSESHGCYGDAADAWGKAADAWRIFDLHEQAAEALQCQADAHRAAGCPDLAAESLESAARTWSDCGNLYKMEIAWDAAAETWESLGQYGRAIKASGQCGWERGFDMDFEPACQ